MGSKVLFLASLLVLLFFSINLVSQIINRRELEGEIAVYQGQINDLEGKNQQLGSLIDYYKTPDFVEEVARTKLNLKKPGEKIIIVPENINDSKMSDKLSVLAAQNLPDYVPNPVKWWIYFFKTN